MKSCAECGGEITVVCVAGRTRKYRGVLCTVPETFPIRTCSKCKSEWMTTAEVKALGVLFEAERRRQMDLAPTMDGDDE
jgi:hypothetical protein